MFFSIFLDKKKEKGFILYAWIDEEGRVHDRWMLKGKHCKNAYMVIQGTSSGDMKRYADKPES